MGRVHSLELGNDKWRSDMRPLNCMLLFLCCAIGGCSTFSDSTTSAGNDSVSGAGVGGMLTTGVLTAIGVVHRYVAFPESIPVGIDGAQRVNSQILKILDQKCGIWCLFAPNLRWEDPELKMHFTADCSQNGDSTITCKVSRKIFADTNSYPCGESIFGRNPKTNTFYVQRDGILVAKKQARTTLSSSLPVEIHPPVTTYTPKVPPVSPPLAAPRVAPSYQPQKPVATTPAPPASPYGQIIPADLRMSPVISKPPKAKIVPKTKTKPKPVSAPVKPLTKRNAYAA